MYHKHNQNEATYLTERPKEHFRTEGTGNVLYSSVATVYSGATEKHVCTAREHRRDCAQNSIQDVSITIQINIQGNLYYNFRNSCFPCLLAGPLISSAEIFPYPSNGYNHKCVRLISFGYESMEFVFILKTEHLFNTQSLLFLLNEQRKENLTKMFKLTYLTVLKNHERGSLSPRHGASSGCGWRNGLQYGG